MAKVGRNEKCPCGSGKKYKKCCLMPIPLPEITELTGDEAEVFVENKQGYLEEHKISDVGFEDEMMCCHCEEKIKVKDYKLVSVCGDDFDYISCPNWPECDGTILDWWPVDKWSFSNVME